MAAVLMAWLAKLTLIREIDDIMLYVNVASGCQNFYDQYVQQPQGISQ